MKDIIVMNNKHNPQFYHFMRIQCYKYLVLKNNLPNSKTKIV